ncbi:MAG: adenine phosphoribosyltransferase [Firmicutes bacterium]|nr:adenine phosphoribosyltransferase [Bacillota bacterium]
MDLRAKIREIPDFPKPGISFKDVTTLFKDSEALRYTIDELARQFEDLEPDMIIGVESRGFILGAPLAYKMGTGFVLVRKPGKLPAECERIEYELEYGSDALEIHCDSLEPGQRVLIIDDLLATGGTVGAATQLVKKLGAKIVGYGFIIELTPLGGRSKLDKEARVVTLVQYDED